MLRVSLLFFVLAVAAGVFGFTGWAGTFTSLAVIGFFVFGAFLVISLLAGLVGVGHWHSGGAFVSLIFAGLVGAGIYAWVDHGMSARNLGAALDQNAAQMTADASNAVSAASDDAKKFVGDVGDSAKQTVDRADDSAEN